MLYSDGQFILATDFSKKLQAVLHFGRTGLVMIFGRLGLGSVFCAVCDPLTFYSTQHLFGSLYQGHFKYGIRYK